MKLDITACQLTLKPKLIFWLCSLFLLGCANANSEFTDRIDVTRLDHIDDKQMALRHMPNSNRPPIIMTRDTTCNAVEGKNAEYGTIIDVVVSPNNQMVAVASSVSVQLYRLPTLEFIKEIDGAYVTIDWSANSQQIMLWSGHYEGWELRIVDIESGEDVYTTYGDTLDADFAVWSQDDSRIAFPSRDGFVHILDIQSENEVFVLDTKSEGNSPIVWSPDGTMLATTGIQVVNVWDSKTGEKIFEFEFDLGGPGYNVLSSLTWSPDNIHLVGLAASSSHRWIWDVVRGQSQEISGIGFLSVRATWSPDGGKLLFAGEKFFQILDAKTLEELSQLEKTGYGGNSWVFWLPDSDIFIYATIDVLQIKNFTNRVISSAENYTGRYTCN